MSKVANKEKGEALQFFYLHEDRTVGDDMMAMLYSDGYIQRLMSVNGSVIRITNKGKAFYLEGGYAGKERRTKKNSRKTFRRNIVTAIIGGLGGAVFGLLLGGWLPTFILSSSKANPPTRQSKLLLSRL